MERVVWETGGRRMLIGNDVYDSKTGAVVQRIENNGLATWEHNGDRIATASGDAIFIWDSTTGQDAQEDRRTGIQVEYLLGWWWKQDCRQRL